MTIAPNTSLLEAVSRALDSGAAARPAAKAARTAAVSAEAPRSYHIAQPGAGAAARQVPRESPQDTFRSPPERPDPKARRGSYLDIRV